MDVESRKMKEINSPDEIPEFDSEREEAEFWATHSLGEEFFEKAQPIPEGVLPPTRPRTRPVSVRLDEDVLRRLKAVAERKHKGYQTMLKEFIAERLYEEEKREGVLREPAPRNYEATQWTGLRGEDWPTTYRRLKAGSEDEWTDDPLSTADSLIVVKAAAHALGMGHREFSAWIHEAPEEAVRARLSDEEVIYKFREELERL